MVVPFFARDDCQVASCWWGSDFLRRRTVGDRRWPFPESSTPNVVGIVTVSGVAGHC
jgi:hypothetical protein